MKLEVQEARFDFRGGRNTAISPDLLNDNELVDATNARLSETYGAFTKRSGCQRIHTTAFPAAIRGVFQWDVPSGKQTVVISNGLLYYRTGLSYTPAFASATTSSVARSSAAQGTSAGWSDPDGTNDGKNIISGVAVDASSTVAAGNRLVLTVGDPAANNNRDAVDDLYTFSFKVTADGTALIGTDGFAKATVTLEVSVDGGAYASVGSSYQVIAGIGEVVTTKFTPTAIVAGAPAVSVTFRPILTVEAGKGTLGTTGTGSGSVQCFDTVYLTDNYPVTWTTGSAALSSTEPAIFATFRESSAGAPLALYIASGGHYFKWDGISTLTQLDPTNSAPLATAIISYHTRMFAMSASPTTPGLLPKTIFWSKIGDATNFTTGAKNQGGSAVTDFLTGQQLTALEVIGSSLLMATIDSVMRFTGQSSDDIVIAQNTEGISAEVGAVGPLALKRFENVAAMLAQRGPYAVTETAAVPIGEQVLPDFNGLDSANISKAIVQYNRGRKELLFAVPGASDGGLNKTVYTQSVRLQAWFGPWLYPFGITCMAHYVGASGIENVIAGCNDGYVRLMDVGYKDDVLADGSGGSNISMRVELPTLHFQLPGVVKTIKHIDVQAKLPLTHNLQIHTTFDTFAEDIGSYLSSNFNNTLQSYRIDVNGTGDRCTLVFTDDSAVAPVVTGFVFHAYDMKRHT